jgi:hypothetical protein
MSSNVTVLGDRRCARPLNGSIKIAISRSRSDLPTEENMVDRVVNIAFLSFIVRIVEVSITNRLMTFAKTRHLIIRHKAGQAVHAAHRQ